MSFFNEKAVAAAVLTTMLVSLSPPIQASRAEDVRTPCLFNQQKKSCEIRLKGDDIELRLEGNHTISINRRGRCSNRVESGITTRSCNVRIGLPNDFVYGLIVRRSSGGTTITSPELEIRLPDLGL